MPAAAIILGVKIEDLTEDELLDWIASNLNSGGKYVISYANIYAANIGYEKPAFRQLLNRSDLTLCDGYGIKMAAFLTGQKALHRITPPDIIDKLCEVVVQKDARIFFLGANEKSVRKAAHSLKSRYPNLVISAHNGYFQKGQEDPENLSVINDINNFRTDLLMVGFGMPLQEEWIMQNLPKLDIKIAFSVGALFDYISGEIMRAPELLTGHGFEWLGRLIIEPRRLWKRYLVGNPKFFIRLFLHHFIHKPLPDDNNA